MGRFVFVLIAAVAPGATACTNFEVVEQGSCGNLVLDVTEDCDGFSAFGEGTACGLPATDNACFYTCDADAGEMCPDGWGCGADDRCRRASGRFAPSPGSPFDYEVHDFAVGDLDGDGKADIVGNSITELSVRYGNEQGEFESSLDVLTSPPRGPVSFSKFDDDDLLDVIVPIGAGISVFTAEDDRSLEPVVYAPLSLDEVFGDNDVAMFLPVNTAPDFFQPQTPMILLADLYDDNDTYVGSAMVFIDQGPGISLPSTHRAADLVGRVPIANLDRDIEERDEIALAFEGASSLYIFTSTGQAGQLNLNPFPYQTIDLGTSRIHRGAHFADVNGDGYDDVMISVREQNDQPRVMVSYNNGFGLLSAPVIEPVFDRGFGEAFPLVAGQIDNSPFADYVYAEEILIGLRFTPTPGPPEFLFSVQSITTAPWSDAALGDYNDDGMVDVAVATQGTDGIDVFVNAVGASYNRFHVDTPEPARALRIGDFDGDVIDDIAFYEKRPDDGNEVSVIFGGPTGPGSEPVEMGDLGDILCFETLHASITLEFDGISDLFVLSSTPQGGNRNVALLQGSSSRRMTSPFTLNEESLSFPDVPFWALVGDFDGDGVRDIAALADTPFTTNAGDVDRTIHLWQLPGATGDGSIKSAAARFVALEDLPNFDATCAVWAAGDLDGDGRDEIVGIDGAVSCGAGPPRVVLARAAQGAGPFEVVVEELTGTYTGVVSAELVDLDADGDLDLFSLFGGDGEGDGAVGQVVIAWNDGGDLSLDASVSVQIEQTPLVRGAGYARTSTQAAPTLVLMAADAMYFAELDAATREYQTPNKVPYPPGDRAVRNGDFNGDGLDDLVY